MPSKSYWWVFFVSAMTAVAFAWWGKWVDAGIHFMRKIADDGDGSEDPPAELPNSLASDRRRAIETRLGQFGAVLYALLMIVLLGWVTVFTGGSFYSPFSQLLLGCALLAPYVANGVWSGAGMGLLSMVSYGVFGYVFKAPGLAQAVPDHLVFLTTVLATLISLATMNLRGLAKRMFRR